MNRATWFRRVQILATAAVAAAVLPLMSVGAAHATAAPTPAPAAVQLPWPSVSPSAEYEAPSPTGWTQQQATDWVNACPAGRFCTWIKHRTNDTYELFQFYRCRVYTLSNWLGVSNFYNHQNVQVELLGSRHEHLRYEPSNYQFITYWNPVFYINLCA